MRKVLGILSFILFAMSSCEKDFIGGPQQTGGKMVINSLFNSNGPITVYLTNSYSLFDSSSTMNSISDAQVSLFEDTSFKEVMHFVQTNVNSPFGAYVSNLTPLNGKSYTIKVTEPQYGQAAATDKIPNATPILSCQLLNYPTNESEMGTVTLVFQDDPLVDNYYRINMWLQGTRIKVNPQGDTTFLDFFDVVAPQVISPLNSDTVRDDPNFLLFSDKGFNGQTKQLQIEFKPESLIQVTNATLWVELHTVSKTHYEYFRTLQIFHHADVINTSQPAYVFSNVQNAYGIFAGENWKVNYLKVK